MENILVAVDFSEMTDVLVDKAVEQAKAFDARVWLVHAVIPVAELVGYDLGVMVESDTMHEGAKQLESKMLQDQLDKVRANGVAASGLLLEGSASKSVLHEAERIGADLIVIGSHQHGPLYNMIIGSDFSKVLQQTKIPLLVVPEPEEN